MDFDESVADQLIVVCDEAVALGKNSPVWGRPTIRNVDWTLDGSRQASSRGRNRIRSCGAPSRWGSGIVWGYQNLTSSEIFGAEHEKSIFLAGAGMHEEWVPDAGTMYSNFVHEDDALFWAQRTGVVWDGKVPSAQEGSTNHFYTKPEGEGDVIKNHSLIADPQPGQSEGAQARAQ